MRLTFIILRIIVVLSILTLCYYKHLWWELLLLLLWNWDANIEIKLKTLRK